jgi:hypothetical protein
MAKVCATIYYFTGNDLNCTVSPNRIDQSFYLICGVIDRQEDDFFDIPGLSPTFNFLGSLPGVETSFIVIITGEPIFVSPKEITNIVLRHLDRLSEVERFQCMSIAVRYLLVNPDPEIAAGWCSVFASIPEQKLREIKDKALELFTVMMQWVWSHSTFVSNRCITSFLQFKDTFQIGDSILSNRDLSEERRNQINSGHAELASMPEKVRSFAFVRFSRALLSTELIPESHIF